MGLANKLLLATKPKELSSWQGYINMPATTQSTMTIMYEYSVASHIGTLNPLLQSVVGMQIYTVQLAVDPDNFLLTRAILGLADPAGNPKAFPSLENLILFSTTGGEPFVINDVKNLPLDLISFQYNIYSGDLMNWGYQNLTAGSSLNFQLKLEWI